MLKTFQPTSDLLKRYIEVFYIFSGDQPREFSYIAFPHVNTAVSFFKGVTLSRGSFEILIEPDLASPDNCCIEILGKYTQPVFVHYKGDFEEVAVIFKPFGINQFIDGEMIKYAANYSQSFIDNTWLSFANDLFKENKTGARINFLESFLLENIKVLDIEMISRSLNLLSETDHSISSIASMHSMNVKTFQRQFMKHMTCTPSEYRRIARFRNALQNRVLSTEVKTLTDITYENNYYDQSYFIREFKKLTGHNPKKFFKAITALDIKKIFWEIK